MESVENAGHVHEAAGASFSAEGRWTNPLLSEGVVSDAPPSAAALGEMPGDRGDSADSPTCGAPAAGRKHGNAVGEAGDDACARGEQGMRRGKKNNAQGSVSFSTALHAEKGENDEDARISCPVDPRHEIYLRRVSAHVKKCTKIRDLAFAHLLPFVLPGCNCGKKAGEHGEMEAGDNEGGPEASPTPAAGRGRDEKHVEGKVESSDSSGRLQTSDAQEIQPESSPAAVHSSALRSTLSPKGIEELEQRVLRAVKQCCEELHLSLAELVPHVGSLGGAAGKQRPVESTEVDVERCVKEDGCNPAAELLRASTRPCPGRSRGRPCSHAELTGHEAATCPSHMEETKGREDVCEEERRAAVLINCIARASKVAAQHRQRQKHRAGREVASAHGGDISSEDVFALAASPHGLQGISPVEWLEKAVALMDKHDEQNAQLVSACALAGFLPTSPDALDGLLVVELGAGKAALTRWLATWAAAAFAEATSQRMEGGQKILDEKSKALPGQDSSENTTGGYASRDAQQEALQQTAPDTSGGNRAGVRFVVVEREARRNAKEMKDEEMQSMSAKRVRSENYFKKKADATDRPSTSTNSPPEGAGKQEDDRAGYVTPRLVRHVVRLRIDISDFDLRALLRYMNFGDSHLLRQPHIPPFFDLLRQHNCRVFPRRPSALPVPARSGQAQLEAEAVPELRCNGGREPARSEVAVASEEGKPKDSPDSKRPRRAEADDTVAAQEKKFQEQENEPSLDAYWELTKQLGCKGGADMKETEACLQNHFLDKRATRVLGVAKHLCGGGTDVALRCFVRCRKAFTEVDFTFGVPSHAEKTADRDGTEPGPGTAGVPLGVSLCLCIAPCCHHRCDDESFVGGDTLRRLGFVNEEFPRLAAATGWATGATGDKQRVGRLIKRLFDLCRSCAARSVGDGHLLPSPEVLCRISPPREESASIALAFAESSRGRGERACQPSGTILTYDGSNDGQGVRITGSHSLAALRSSSSASASKLASSTGSQWILGLRGGFNLQVKTMSGKTVVLDNVNASDSILDIKRRVEQREGIPVDQQRLVFNGKQLENGKTVQDYDLSENSVLHLVLRLRGGGNAKDAAVNN
ncbi:hypothetical protein BESB_062870 [Besnoitia besnoiti]|uniref:tRNA:m(4)X modification enzyme TRM13 n=1 Tax=Besnoitia besnoiti TaxID=94643 RepID=A0A2A9MJ30_BESBE|nr:hypothetical protein BESB_062870 [Besnoitia besnoiti]PFH35400.1 hypothetical protein BESB_062870 [Besnoitia besnoiti]